MQHVLIIHEVASYPAWKQVFDAAASIRQAAGERSWQLLRYANEPQKIVHFSVWTSIAAAKTFFESPALVQLRKDAGVHAPEFIYLEQIEAGSF
jgi:quinol monooxygenase YgiN